MSDSMWLKPLKEGGNDDLPPAPGQRYGLHTNPHRDPDSRDIKFTKAGEPHGKWNAKAGDLVALYWKPLGPAKGVIVGVVRVLVGATWVSADAAYITDTEVCASRSLQDAPTPSQLGLEGPFRSSKKINAGPVLSYFGLT